MVLIFGAETASYSRVALEAVYAGTITRAASTESSAGNLSTQGISLLRKSLKEPGRRNLTQCPDTTGQTLP